MIDCRANLALLLPTVEGDRLSVAEIVVSVVFSPSQPMIEFKVLNINVLLKDFSKLVGVASFMSAMEGNSEEHEMFGASPDPDIYRDAFLEKSQRFFSLSSEGMKSAFQQMDSVINLKGKIQSISSFIPDTDQLLAAEQEAIAFAEARSREQRQHETKQKQHDSLFPRPASTQSHNQDCRQLNNNTDASNATNRPKSILGGLVRSGWKTLANSVAIPDDDPAIYGEYVPSQQPQAPLQSNFDQPVLLYRKDEETSKVGPTLYRSGGTQSASKQEQEPRMQYQRGDGLNEKFENSNKSDTFGNHTVGSHEAPQHLQTAVAPSDFGIRTTTSNKISHSQEKNENNNVDIRCNENSIEKNVPSQEATTLSVELRDAEEHEIVEDKFETDLDDGWDDDLDVFDDVGADVDESFDRQASPLEQNQEECSLDAVLVDPLMPTGNIVSSCGTKYDEEGDTCATRKRWSNPRPNRPYLRY